MKRYQRVWLEKHPEINFSGLNQVLINEIMKTHDPEYYAQHKQFMDLSLIRKNEVIDRIVKSTPIITKS